MSVNILENGQLIPVAGELYKGVGNLSFAGQVVMGANVNTPLGWLKCDGKAYDKTVYPDLYKAIGDTYNKPDTAADKFNVPDLAGKYVMGTDAENAVGSNIEESLPNHSHAYTDPGHTHRIKAGGSGVNGNGAFDQYTQKQLWEWSATTDKTNIVIDGVDNTYNEAGEKVENTIYKNGAKVRPDSVVLSYFIKF